MPDFDLVQGMGDECGDPDHENHDPAGHCGNGFHWPSNAGARFGGYSTPRYVRPTPLPVRCNRCGTAAVRWHHTGERWALLGDDNKIHACGRVATADDFEDVS